MFIDTLTTIKRTHCLWDLSKINDEVVGAYLKILNEKHEKIEELKLEIPYSMRDSIEKTLEELLHRIETEIKVCKFYFEYNQKKRKLEYFNQWKLLKKEDRPDLVSSWEKESPHGEAWVMTNGRIMSIIEIKDNVSSIRVSLKIKNDSEFFNFVSSQYGPKEICYKNFRKKESAAEHAEELKNYAAEILKKDLLPSSEEYGNTEILLKLLHLNLTIQEE